MISFRWLDSFIDKLPTHIVRSSVFNALQQLPVNKTCDVMFHFFLHIRVKMLCTTSLEHLCYESVYLS